MVLVHGKKAREILAVIAAMSGIFLESCDACFAKRIVFHDVMD